VNGEYNQSSDQPYVRDELYANDASHFISAYQLLEADLMKLFTFIEPADANLSTYSHRLYELLLRASTEFEANARAVLVANGYSKTGRWNIFDYAKLEPACRLSAFATTLPVWRGSDSVRRPFSVWAKNQNASLPWYADYNSVKHNRSGEFELATLGNVIDAVSGVFIMLFAQFNIRLEPVRQSYVLRHNPIGDINSSGLVFSDNITQLGAGQPLRFRVEEIESEYGPNREIFFSALALLRDTMRPKPRLPAPRCGIAKWYSKDNRQHGRMQL